ncbi:hypothetical protein BOO69_18915 (plasmid) [Sulfitobacter alexandrii]|uniref:Type II toxin-antitoxin system RelE/ParE family toxin n=1 Tax=Sulfitobacter alexandrii TaxID=1917485 RepID=A0A1J0WN81_9RHOB|nr:type II toxin-antitoxin system RelE/ParE family toxin [Sulfitobacter alexandrii]APE45638.1 hypothetical protein BOO69_18915 [Sulfitobacter alexandrii]
MTWTIEISEEAYVDLELHHAHLLKSQIAFGHAPDDAMALARTGIVRMLDIAERLADMPHVGTKHPDLLVGIRHVTIERCIFWFRPDTDTRVIRILAVFRSGQDHFKHIIARLGNAEKEDG